MARALPWFEDEDPRDLRRWVMAAFIVVAIHLSAIAAYVYVHRPDDTDDDAPAITIDIAPGESAVEQQAVAEVPQQQPIEKPPPDASEAAPEPPPPPKVEEPPTPAKPALQKGGAPHVASEWERSLTQHLQKFKRYPGGAQSRGEEGLVLLRFSVDRNGHVLAHDIAQSSGHPDLDAEVMRMIERAQPLPPFPVSMAEAELDELIVPIRFSLH
jgi:protein TonB